MKNSRIRMLLILLGILVIILAIKSIALRKNQHIVRSTAETKEVSSIRDASGKNIVICILDAARYDHVGCYNYPRATTPNIDRLAKESVVFDRHYSASTWTFAATRSFFLSRYAVPVEVKYNEHSLIESLNDSGFDTILFSSHPNVTGTGILGEGFNRKEITFGKGMNLNMKLRSRLQLSQAIPLQNPYDDYFYRPEYLLEKIDSWLKAKPQQPFFTYIHFIPPHTPFAAPKEMQKLFLGKKPPNYWTAPSAFPAMNDPTRTTFTQSADVTVNLYDANMLWADWAIGRLEELLKQSGVWEDTLFIVTADHGEALGEHGYTWHEDCPYDEVKHIPLIIRFPGKDRPTGRVSALTHAIDVLPTIFDIHELSYPAIVQGKSLLPLVAGETDKVRDYTFSPTGEGRMPFTFYNVMDSRYTLILYNNGITGALYDVIEDPHQTENIIKTNPEEAVRLLTAFYEFAVNQPDQPLHFVDPSNKPTTDKMNESQNEEELSDDIKKKLRTLGYVD